MLAEPSAVTGRWCMSYLHAALIVTRLDSSLSTLSFLSCSTEPYCYIRTSSPSFALELVCLPAIPLFIFRWLVLPHLGIHTLYVCLKARAEQPTQ